MENLFSSMVIYGKSILFDGDPWKIDSQRWGYIGAQPGNEPDAFYAKEIYPNESQSPTIPGGYSVVFAYAMFNN